MALEIKYGAILFKGIIFVAWDIFEGELHQDESQIVHKAPKLVINFKNN